MSRSRKIHCQVCEHEERWRLELLRASGASLDSLATKFGVHRDAIWRHWNRHVSDEAKSSYLCGPAEMASLAQKAAAEGDSVLDYLRMCRSTLVAQLAAMGEAGDARAVGYIAGQLTKTLETMAKVTGEIGDLARSVTINNTNVAVLNHPQFASVQATLLRALAPFAEARMAVVAALRDLDSGNARAGSPVKVIDHVAA
jgi:hypothetical protein